MYKEADPMSLITVEPSYIEYIYLQEDIHGEENKDDNRNVITHCESCDVTIK